MAGRRRRSRLDPPYFLASGGEPAYWGSRDQKIPLVSSLRKCGLAKS
jgi:hypothetical protein